MLISALLFIVYLQECVDPCCNTTSCQLVAGAKCRASACCLPNCQLKEYGTVCREARARTDCDIEEYCNGYESECPRDTVLQNLTPCMSNQSFCFSGECQTREDQCQYHFETGSCGFNRGPKCRLYLYINRQTHLV